MPDPHAANARPAAEKPGIGGVSDWPVLAPAPAAVVTSLDKSPTFSILVAAYQVADVIGEALESAFGQTHPALEVIVCDDGSTDDLERALEPHRGRIVLTRKENGGEGSAKNTAAQLANGDYLVILDADDRYLPRRLEALAHLARTRPDLDLLTTDAYLEAYGTIVRRCYASGRKCSSAETRRNRSPLNNAGERVCSWQSRWECDQRSPTATSASASCTGVRVTTRRLPST